MPADTRPARIEVEDLGSGVLLGRVGAGRRGVFVAETAADLRALVRRAERDDDVRAVILTGTHPSRFISHADIDWLQAGGAESPVVGPRAAAAVARLGAAVRRTRPLATMAPRTPLGGVVELDRLHDTLVRMNSCGAIFIAALNGSALGFGAELSWACDLRLMASGEHFIGQPEILLGFNPGGGGTQRLTRLVGTHRALLAMLEGRPLPAREALEIGALDEVVAAEELIDRATSRARNLGSRPKAALAAVKRAVYLGGSMTLTEGLHQERAEFLSTLAGEEAQRRMLDYMERTEVTDELPLYDPDAYADAVETGRLGAPTREARGR